MVAFRFVWRDFRRGEDRAEEQPRAKLAADQIGMLALPAKPGSRSQRLFHDGRCIDEHLDVLPGAGGKAACHMLELALDDVVIVAVLRIDRDCRAVFSSRMARD